MFERHIMLAMGMSALALGCTDQPAEPSLSPRAQEIISNLVKAGFPVNDITVVNDVVYVGRDAEVNLVASREMVATGDSSKEQYRTSNIISTSLRKICIDGSTFTGSLSTALDLAIQNYNELPLTFDLARTPATDCGFTISAVVVPGLVGSFSGFPANGLPFASISIGDGLAAFSVDTIEHDITHELGHTIGLRHSDFFDRSISCGTGGNEGDAGIGAILIPGTPRAAGVGESVMNSCFRAAETGEFTAGDIVALKRIYGPLVEGSIVDGATDAVIAQALQVTVEGPDRALVTNADGAPLRSFTVAGGTLSVRFDTSVNPTEVTPVRITLVVSGSGFVPTSLPLTLTAAVTQFSLKMASLAAPPAGVATARLAGQADPVGTVLSTMQLQANEPASSVTATATLPAGTVVTDASGAALSGALTMEAAYFSPTVGASLASFPGGLSVDTTDQNGNVSGGEFVSAGLMSLEITDAVGRKAKNFSGAGMQLNMEIPAGTVNPVFNRPLQPGDVIPIFSNDTATGRWFEEGTVTVALAPNRRMVANFNVRHLSLWNLDFKVSRCTNFGGNTQFQSRRLVIRDNSEAQICSNKLLRLRIQLQLNGGPVPASYSRVLAPVAPQPDVIQFMNMPQVLSSQIQIFDDVNHNSRLDVGEAVVGRARFPGAVGTMNNLCPVNALDTAPTLLFLFFDAVDVPGNC